MALRPRTVKVDHLKYGPSLPGGRKVYQLPDWKKMSDAKKVKYIRTLMFKFGRDPRVRNLAVKIYRQYGVQPRDYKGQAQALLKYTQDHIYYLNEPSEMLQNPLYTTNPKVMSGDCDDIAILLGALAVSSRLGIKIVLSGKDPRTGKMVRWVEGTPEPRGIKWGHIYVQVGWPAFRPVHWESMEGTLKGAPLGWDVTRAHLYPPIPGAPGVPLYPGASSPGGYGALSITPRKGSPGAPSPLTPLPSPKEVLKAGKVSRARDEKEKKVRKDLEKKAFWAGIDWQDVITATLPAIISGYVLARILRR